LAYLLDVIGVESGYWLYRLLGISGGDFALLVVYGFG
jgi:hypothetical protein